MDIFSKTQYLRQNRQDNEVTSLAIEKYKAFGDCGEAPIDFYLQRNN